MLLESLRASYELPVFGSPEDRLCRPSKGRSLGATVSQVRQPIDAAVAALISGFRAESDHMDLFSYLCSRHSAGAVCESSAYRFAWFAVNASLTAALAQGSTRTFPVQKSVEWFFGDNQRLARSLLNAYSEETLLEVHRSLQKIVLNTDFVDLLPYVLEPHGHVTRGDLAREIGAATKREKKRQSGVYYTPSDVAEFMVREVVGDGGTGVTWLDPACGTAVFLREILRSHRRQNPRASALRYCRSSVYGLDISALTTESAVFVLLVECARTEDIAVSSPFEAWQSIAKNIRSCDATILVHGASAITSLIHDERVSLADIFPETNGRFDRVIMNPPYSSLEVTDERRSLWDSLCGIKNGYRPNAATVFVEMMWKLTKPNGAASAVLPLAIGVSSHSEYKACRAAIQDSPGGWEFLFYDREPHALFGEDIKTRNAIVFRYGNRADEMRTSRLLKWTSAMRPKIFTRLRTAPMGERDIEAFIPKLGSEMEAELYALLEPPAATRQKPSTGRTTLSDIRGLDKNQTLLVSASAYNFLNAFLPDALDDVNELAFSESPLHVLTFPTREYRDCGLAILASRLAYWLWHVEGDGFHVTSSFLTRLPLWDTRLFKQSHRLGGLGRDVWQEAVCSRARALNGGKVTYSFHCAFDRSPVRLIDELLFEALGVPKSHLAAVERFVLDVTSIDGTKRRRKIY